MVDQGPNEDDRVFERKATADLHAGDGPGGPPLTSQVTADLPTAKPSEGAPADAHADETGPSETTIGAQSDLAARFSTSSESSTESEEFLRAIAFDVVDKQYRLYTWNDTKTQALITTNSILLAAVGFLYRDSLRDTLALLFVGLGTLCLGWSLTICLVHVIPRISSGKSGGRPNTRSLRGIGLYGAWEDYRDAFMLTTKAGILTDTIRQIYGMADNNLRSARIITRGVRLTQYGVVAIVAAVFTIAGAARGCHVLGVWDQVEIAADPSALVATPHVVAQAPPTSTTPETTLPDTSNSEEVLAPAVAPPGQPTQSEGR